MRPTDRKHERERGRDRGREEEIGIGGERFYPIIKKLILGTNEFPYKSAHQNYGISAS